MSVDFANISGDIEITYTEHCTESDNPCLYLEQHEDMVRINKSQWPKIRDYLEEYFK